MSNRNKNNNNFKSTIERLGISPEYQYQILHSGPYFQSNWFENKLAAVEHIINFSKNMRVLDLGSGSGTFELKFAKSVQEIIALDNFDPALNFLGKKLTKEGIKNVKLISKDLCKIDEIKGLGKFDLIILLDVIEHIKLKDLELIIRSCKALLKRGGVIFVTTPNYRSSWILLEKIWDKLHPISHLHDSQHITRFHKGNLRDLFEKSGYKLKYITSTNLLSFMIPYRGLSIEISLLELHIPLCFGNLLVGVFDKSPNF